jgi:uncharacterized protein
MQFSLANQGDQYSVTAYEPGLVEVGGREYKNSVVLFPDKIIDNWRPHSIDDIQPEDFSLLLELTPDVILLGSGERQIFPPVSLYAPVIDSGIGIEIMDNAAACRTYNILLAEGRRVAAAILLT